ncbi:ATP-binding protein [Streptomyces sp. CA-142005]|uniref:ATP-binding protein n=1 Tax=Streptomyces sp. CA-142005 TaxID=3240052 RepID=UPI003D8C47FB
MTITPMRTSNTGPLIERVHRESHPFQWAREALINAREAGATQVEFGVEWHAVEQHGVYRRTVADDGSGMAYDEIEKFLNTFGGGGKPIGDVHQNYGIGVKTSLLPWNKHGLVVISVKDGDESLVWLQHDPVTGEYGLRRIPATDETGRDTIEHVVEPSPIDGLDWSEAVPDFVRKAGHGTVLILLGNAPDQDTVLGDPDREEGRPHALRHYLNTRVWNFVQDMDVKVLEFRTQDREQWPRERAGAFSGSRAAAHRRTVVGAKASIVQPVPDRDFAVRAGTAHVSAGTAGLGAKIHWWLWQEDRPNLFSGHFPKNGYVAALYNEELYDRTDHHASYRSFGISHKAVREKLWIIVEPEPFDSEIKAGVYPDSSRSRLLVQGSALAGAYLPMSEWGAQFANNLPQEIADALSAATAGSTGSLDSEWRDRLLERFGSRWRIPRWIASPNGHRGIEPTQRGGTPGNRAAAKTKKKPRSSGGGSGGRSGEPAIGKPGGTVPGRVARTGAGLPEYKIVPSSEMDEPEMLAEYLGESSVHPTGLIRVNIQHPALAEVIVTWQNAYPDHLAESIAEEIGDVYGQVAVAKVAHSEHYRSKYDPTTIEEMRSSKSLTMALLGLMAEDAMIATRLGGKYGRRKAA